MPVNLFHVALSALQNRQICAAAWPTVPGARPPVRAALLGVLWGLLRFLWRGSCCEEPEGSLRGMSGGVTGTQQRTRSVRRTPKQRRRGCARS